VANSLCFFSAVYTGWSKSFCAPDDYSTKLMIWRLPSHNTFGMWTMLYWTRSSRTKFGVSINVWDWWGTPLNIIVTFCIVIIRCIDTFWSPCTSQQHVINNYNYSVPRPSYYSTKTKCTISWLETPSIIHTSRSPGRCTDRPLTASRLKLNPMKC
jgi:hypothetical protein